MKPTVETYAELQFAYDTFNRRLFDNQLPDCLITLQREKRTYGYFSADRFGNRQGDTVGEIALNPTYFAVVPLVEIMQTLAHEQTHIWQQHFGNPGRGRYHNEEFANKLESIGLMPSSTGQPGGKHTGDSMADYAIEGGLFLQVCRELLTQDYKISWYDRFAPPEAVKAGQSSFGLSLDLPASGVSIPATSGIRLATALTDTPAGAVNKSNRSKYTCSCDISVWGKPRLTIICGQCGRAFAEVSGC